MIYNNGGCKNREWRGLGKKKGGGMDSWGVDVVGLVKGKGWGRGKDGWVLGMRDLGVGEKRGGVCFD